jgi:hypothetical protein
MRAGICAGLALLLAGCASMDSNDPEPSASALEDGNCHALAQERETEARWLDLDGASQRQVFAAAYDECQQWKASHAWKE